MKNFKQFLSESVDNGSITKDDLNEINKLTEQLLEEHDKTRREIALELKKVMEVEKMTFKELCERTGKSSRTLNGILQGTANPTIGTVTEIFQALDKNINFSVK